MNLLPDEEMLVRWCAGRFADWLHGLGKDWTKYYEDGIRAIQWQTKSANGTPLGGACVIRLSTEGGRLLAQYIELKRPAYRKRVARYRAVGSSGGPTDAVPGGGEASGDVGAVPGGGEAPF